MKKLTISILLLVFVLILAGCSNNVLNGIDKAAEVTVIKFNTSTGEEMGTAAITSENDIKHIADNLCSLKLKKIENSEPAVLEYQLTFYSADGEIIKIISIPSCNWIGLDGYFYSISDGELNRGYIAGLFEHTE